MQEEIEAFNVAMAEGWDELPANFMNNLGINNQEGPQVHEVVWKDELAIDEDDELFENF